MSIQQQIQHIQARAARSEIQFFFIIAAVVTVCIFTQDWGYAVALCVAYIPLSMGLRYALSSWRESRILELYCYQAEPIIEIQENLEDAFVFFRAETHRRYLCNSGNKLYAENLITVEEIYLKDVRFGFGESAEQQAEKRADFVRDFINDWALALSKDNALLVKQWLNGQVIPTSEPPPVVPITPSVSEEKTPDFWANQFPLFTKLIHSMRGNAPKHITEA